MKRIIYLLVLLVVACGIPVRAASLKGSLPAPVIQYGKATVKITFRNYKPEMFGQTSFVAYNNLIAGVNEVTVGKIKADGTWNGEVIVLGTTPCELFIGRSTSIPFYIETGKLTELMIDLSEVPAGSSDAQKSDIKGQLVGVTGPLADITKELNAPDLPPYSLQQWLYAHIADLGGLDPASFKARLTEQMKQLLNGVKGKVSKPAYELISLNNTIDFQSFLAQSDLTTIAALRAKIITSKEAQNYYENAKKQMKEDYFNPADLSVVNTPEALLSPRFRNGVGVLNDRSEAEVSKMLKVGKGVYFDARKARSISKKLSDYTPLTEEDQAVLATLPAAARESLEQSNKELLAVLAANKSKTGYHVNELPKEVANEDVFTTITNAFKGKVILVDFWATWCGPCRQANKQMAPMKESLKDRNIIYVYVTGETSPLATWKNMIPDVPGEHYRLTADQWKYVLGTFKIRGIPSYVIVNKEGAVAYQTTGFPGVDKMKEELLKAVGQ